MQLPHSGRRRLRKFNWWRKVFKWKSGEKLYSCCRDLLMKIHMSENFTKRIFFISFKINNAEEKLIAAPSLQPALVLPQ